MAAYYAKAGGLAQCVAMTQRRLARSGGLAHRPGKHLLSQEPTPPYHSHTVNIDLNGSQYPRSNDCCLNIQSWL